MIFQSDKSKSGPSLSSKPCDKCGYTANGDVVITSAGVLQRNEQMFTPSTLGVSAEFRGLTVSAVVCSGVAWFGLHTIYPTLCTSTRGPSTAPHAHLHRHDCPYCTLPSACVLYKTSAWETCQLPMTIASFILACAKGHHTVPALPLP